MQRKLETFVASVEGKEGSCGGGGAGGARETLLKNLFY